MSCLEFTINTGLLSPREWEQLAEASRTSFEDACCTQGPSPNSTDCQKQYLTASAGNGPDGRAGSHENELSTSPGLALGSITEYRDSFTVSTHYRVGRDLIEEVGVSG